MQYVYNDVYRSRPMGPVTLCLCSLLLSLSLIGGCSAKQKAPAATTKPVAAAPAAPAAQPQPDPQHYEPPASEKGTRIAQAVKESAQARMLQSAGRDPKAVQPEAGFLLNVPDSVGDGEAFLVEFGAAGVKNVRLTWRDKTLNLDPAKSRKAGAVQALLPVPLDEKAATLPLVMTVTWQDGKSERFSTDLKVAKRKYPVQKLKVAQKYVTPPADMQAKIKQDRAEMKEALASSSSQQYWSLPMLRPVPGQITSLFGLRRVFNGQPRSPHRGLDLDGNQGDPIAAMDDGIVTLVSEHYYGGNTVVVDHGLGVFSMYLHLSGFNVTKGQKLSRGDVVGYVGKTGRVTGPHLHLSLSVQGVSVNPATCIDM